MANKTATLKNQAGDNIYPNIVGDNMNAAIKDSTTIKHTLAENKISLDLDETIKGKIDAALQKPTGLTKTKLVGVGASGQENIEIGDNLTLANGKLSAAGGGGKSVPPTLWLIDLDKLEARTTITEEEYNNLKNGLYNQVIYFPDTDYNDAYYLSKLVYVFNEFYFVQCHGVYDDALNSDRIVSLIEYSITIGEKDTSGNYPITIKKDGVMPFGSGGGGPSASSDNMHVIVKKSENEKITLTEAEFDNLAKDDYELAITTGTDLTVYDEKSVTKDSSTGNVVTIDFTCTIVRTVGQLILMQTSRVEVDRNNLVSDIVTNTSLMTKSKLFNKNVMTYDSYSPENILPCTTADNGKVLSVVNGQAQWANASGGVSIIFED